MSSSPSKLNSELPVAVEIQPSSPRYPLPPPKPPSQSSSTTTTTADGAPRKIAIPLDLSEESSFAVEWAVQNYLRPNDSVTLIHVRPTSVLYGADWGSTHFTPSDGDSDSKQMEEDFASFTAGKIAEVAQPLVDAKIGFKVHVVKDHDMKERLCLEIERLGMSAVIMGSRGFGASASRRTNKSRLGSVSDYCVHHCVCPVVVVRFPQGKGTAAADSGSLHPVPEGEPEAEAESQPEPDQDSAPDSQLHPHKD